MKTKNLTKTAIFMALTTITTMVVNIPIPATGGYVNLSDSTVLLSALLLPFPYNLVAAGLGPMLADLILGYSVYAPATLIIKAVEAYLAYLIFKKFSSKAFVAFVVASFSMPLGYFIYETFLYNSNTALAALVPNIIQGLVGALVASLLYGPIKKNIKALQ